MIYQIRPQTYRQQVNNLLLKGLHRAERYAGESLNWHLQLNKSAIWLEKAYHYAELAHRIEEWWRE